MQRFVCRWIESALLLAGATAAVAPAVAGPAAPGPGELLMATPSTLTRVQAGGARTSQPLPADLTTPLGSTWKLLVYGYLAGRDIRPPDYRCQGQDPDEAFCCTPGESIDAEQALAQSCGPYFSPRRLGIAAADWQRFWQGQAPQLPWLARLNAMQPATEVPVAQLLAAIRALPPAAARDARAALLAVTLDGRGAGSVRYFGSGLRAKTWTWDHPQRPREKIGGFAGWLADLQPVWAASYGPSTALFRDWSQPLAPLLQRPAQPDTGACVMVRYFADYPVRSVTDDQGRPAVPGVLQGTWHVHFARGTTTTVQSSGELVLRRRADGRLWLQGRLDLDDYVARVVEREAALEPTAAARALAVSARSYVVQNAVHDSGCHAINDSTRQQRVLPRPASPAALQLARWTSDLIVSGVRVHYHRDQPGPDVLAWTRAVQQAQQGVDFVDILRASFPRGRLVSLHAPDASQCTPLPHVQRWLAAQVPGWTRLLQEEAGFELPSLPQVCRLASGRPQVDLQRKRVWVAGLAGQENRVSLAHEWLHLAFARHPRGRDEFYIEAQARRLNGLGAADWK